MCFVCKVKVSKSLTVHHAATHRWSSVPTPERPAGRPTEAPNHLHSQSAQQRILQEHVTRVASGEGSSARAVDLHQLQIRPPRGGRLTAGAPASSSPPESAVQPPSGPQARADRRREQEERCHLAAAHEAPRAAAPRALQPIRLRRAAQHPGRRCARLAASCWPSAMRSTLLSSMIEALPSS